MQGKIITGILCILPLGVCGSTTCMFNYLKYDADKKCCAADATKCSPSLKCGTGKYLDTTKYGTAAGTDGAACCTNQAKCSAVTCGNEAGEAYKKKNGVADVKCALGAVSLCANEPECCELDNSKCGGQATKTCNSGSYWDDDKVNVAVGGDAKANCCKALPTCDKVTCAAGMKKKTGVGSSTKCTEGDMSTMCKFAGTCCELDTAKCAGSNVVCGTGKTLDSTKAGTSVGSDAVAACCKTSTATAPLCEGVSSDAHQFQWTVIPSILTIYGAASCL